MPPLDRLSAALSGGTTSAAAVDWPLRSSAAAHCACGAALSVLRRVIAMECPTANNTRSYAVRLAVLLVEYLLGGLVVNRPFCAIVDHCALRMVLCALCVCLYI